MINALLIALAYIAIICVIAAVIVRLVPMPAPVGMIVWAVVTIICLLILLRVFTGSSLGVPL
jgi:hypothetical protein